MSGSTRNFLQTFKKKIKTVISNMHDIAEEFNRVNKRLQEINADIEKGVSREIFQDELNTIHNKLIGLQKLARINFFKQNSHVDPSEYSLFSWKDAKGKTQNFMGKNTMLSGADAEIRFGYKIDDKGNIAKKEMAVRYLKRTKMEESNYIMSAKNEIVFNKILHKDVSDIITFDNGSIGFFMEKLPGFDFAKRWEDEYRSVLVQESEPDKANMKVDQLVLTKDKVYWLEDGELQSFEFANMKSPADRKTIQTYYNEYRGSAVNNRELINCLKNASQCKYGRGLDFGEFNKLKLTAKQRCQIMRDLYKQLHVFHKAGFCHGDINPTNIKIYIDENGSVHAKLFDFGQARVIGRKSFISLNDPIGMPEFVAPESVEEKTYKKASDIYSLGAIAGMLFSDNPNDFIKDKSLERERQVKSDIVDHNEMTQEIYKKGYNFSAMFCDSASIADVSLKDRLSKFIREKMLGAKADDRPTSKNAVSFFDKMVKEIDKNEQQVKISPAAHARS